MAEAKIYGYSREQLMTIDPVILRTFLHERTHHGIEVMIYRILNGKMKKPSNFGAQAKTLLDIWIERKLPTDAPDLQWCKRYVELADRMNREEKVKLDTGLPRAFSSDEMRTVKNLLFERRSIRQYTSKPVSDETIREILAAGLMAPQGCNVGATRFIVLRDLKEMKMVMSDIPIDNGVMILICQDLRVYKSLRFDEITPQNLYFDVAAAADHMVLMAHALGLGACWLTHGIETQKKIRQYFGLPETFITRCHIMVGWPDEAPIKSGRARVDEVTIEKKH